MTINFRVIVLNFGLKISKLWYLYIRKLEQGFRKTGMLKISKGVMRNMDGMNGMPDL